MRASGHSLLCLVFVLGLSMVARAATVRESGLSEFELQLWNSPRFQKQFTESYLAETDIEPRVTELEREKMLEVLELISSDKMDEAARLLQAQITEASSAVFDFTLANIYFQQDNLQEAAARYKSAVEKYPKFRRAHKNLALIHIRNEAFKEAIPHLTRVVELGGRDALTCGLLGFAYASVENSLCAESAYRQAILMDPVTLDWKMGLARSLFRQQRYAEAATFCDTLIADDPNRVDLWLLQANAYVGLNQPLKAAVNYELVDRLGKSTADSLNMLGDIYVNQELFELAVDYYIRALEKDPQRNPQRAIRAAKVLAGRGALAETKQLVERIEALCGSELAKADRKELLMLQVRCMVAERSGEKEIKVLEKIVELDPLDGEALIMLGQRYARAGNYEKAVLKYEQAASLEKYEADAKVRHAQLLVKQGKYAEALPLLRRAQDLEPREDVQKYLEQVERVAKSR